MSALATGLVPGQLYNIFVWTLQPAKQRTVPLPPATLSICENATTVFSICIMFSPPMRGEYDSFQVLYTTDYDDWEGSGIIDDVTGNTTVIDDLSPATSYWIRVRTRSGMELSTAEEIHASTLSVELGKVEFQNVTHSSFRAWWLPITNYTGNYTAVVQPGNVTAVVSAESPSTYLFTSLPSSTVFEVQVRTTIGLNSTGSVRTGPAPVSNVQLNATGPISLAAGWDPPDIITSFNELRVVLELGGEEVLAVQTPASVTNYTFDCLQPDTEYTLRITSILLADGPFEEQETEADDQPSTETDEARDEEDPYVYATGATSLTLHWSKLELPGHGLCLVEYCRQLLDSPRCVVNGSDICSWEVEFGGLDPGQLYLLYTTINGTLTELETVRTRPLPPGSVSVTAVNSRLIQVRWTPQPNIQMVRISYYETEGAGNGDTFTTLNDGEYDIHQLDSRTEYTVELQSIGRQGGTENAPDSNVVRAVAETAERVLTDLSVRPDSITLLWNEQADPADFTDYLLEWGSNTAMIPQEADSTYAYTISDLVAGELYTFSLYLRPLVTYPAPLEVVTLRTEPNPPMNLRAQDEMLSSFRLVWDLPAEGLYRGFIVDIDPRPNLQDLPATVGADITSFTFEGLTPDTPYTAEVTTIMGLEGLMRTSDTKTFNIETDSGPGDDLYLVSIGTNEAVVGFSRSISDFDFGCPMCARQASDNRLNLTELEPGREYTLEVEFNDTAVITGELTFTTIPEEPRFLRLRRTGPYSMEWEVDTSLGGQLYDRLQVSYSPESMTTPSPFDISRCDDGLFVLEGLQPDTEYQVSVTAIAGNARSQPRTEYRFTTCPEPGRLNLVSVGTDAVTAAWGANDAAEDYMLSAQLNGVSVQSLSLPITSLTGTLTGLAPTTSYILQLSGTVGSVSNRLDSLNFTTLPSAPGAISLETFTQTRLTFSWDAAANTFDRYEIFLVASESTASQRRVGTVAPTEERMLEVGGLQPDTLYNIQIYAVAGDQRSLPSEEAFRTADEILEFEDDGSAVVVTWEEQADAVSYEVIYTTTNRDTVPMALSTVSTSVQLNNTIPGAIYSFTLVALANDDTETTVAISDYVKEWKIRI
ncbi:fibronectin-like [Diadema setosum]|uniref:fibronectin-like n=1 Tax=Diadema setosum TaxID=31175 RepID=UPI003B3AD6E6